MAYDIGPKIGIDGEAEFRRELQNVKNNIKSLGNEMKLVTAVFDDNADSMEALAAKSEVLKKTYDEQEKYLAQTSKMLEAAKGAYGENSKEVQRWQDAVTKAKIELQKTANEIKKTETAIDNLGDGTDDAEKALKDLGEAAEDSSGKFNKFDVAAGNLISGAITGLAGVAADVARTIYDLDDATEEYRVAMGKLNSAFESSGHNAEVAKSAYRELYKIMGDTDSATEAAQLMAQLSDSEKDFEKWTRIAAGAASVFGDSLPVENMFEFLTETEKTGQITGDFTRMLQYAGIAEDDFQRKLDACSTESERNRLIMDTLTEAYDEATDAFYKNNEEVVRSRENQAKLDEITGKLGDSVSELKNAFVEEFGEGLANAAESVANFISGLDDEAMPYLDGAKDFVEGMFETIPAIWTGNFEAAGQGIKKAMRGIVDVVKQAAIDISNNGLVQRLSASGAFNFDITNTPIKTTTTPTTSTSNAVSGNGGNSGSGDVYLDGQKVGRVIRSETRANDVLMF